MKSITRILTGYLLLACVATTVATAQPSVPEGYDPGDSRAQIFEQANEHYLDNEFDAAIRGYQHLFDKGVRNGLLCYNLGNAYFAAGNLGYAVLWYERARLFLPRFEDLQVNLNVARGQLVDEELRSTSGGGTLGLVVWLIEQASLNEWMWASVAMLWVFSSLILCLMFIRKESLRSRFRIPCWIAGFTFILFTSCATYRWVEWSAHSDAVIVASAVEVKSGPGAELSTSFTLHEGTTVRTVQHENNWVRIELPGNRTFTGWIEQSSLETIVVFND